MAYCVLIWHAIEVFCMYLVPLDLEETIKTMIALNEHIGHIDEVQSMMDRIMNNKAVVKVKEGDDLVELPHEYTFSKVYFMYGYT